MKLPASMYFILMDEPSFILLLIVHVFLHVEYSFIEHFLGTAFRMVSFSFCTGWFSYWFITYTKKHCHTFIKNQKGIAKLTISVVVVGDGNVTGVAIS